MIRTFSPAIPLPRRGQGLLEGLIEKHARKYALRPQLEALWG